MRILYAIRDASTGSWLESTRWVALGEFNNAQIFLTNLQAQSVKDEMTGLLRRHPIWWNLGRRHERSTEQPCPVLEVVPCTVAPTPTADGTIHHG